MSGGRRRPPDHSSRPGPGQAHKGKTTGGRVGGPAAPVAFGPPGGRFRSRRAAIIGCAARAAASEKTTGRRGPVPARGVLGARRNVTNRRYWYWMRRAGGGKGRKRKAAAPGDSRPPGAATSQESPGAPTARRAHGQYTTPRGAGQGKTRASGSGRPGLHMRCPAPCLDRRAPLIRPRGSRGAKGAGERRTAPGILSRPGAVVADVVPGGPSSPPGIPHWTARGGRRQGEGKQSNPTQQEGWGCATSVRNGRGVNFVPNVRVRYRPGGPGGVRETGLRAGARDGARALERGSVGEVDSIPG